MIYDWDIEKWLKQLVGFHFRRPNTLLLLNALLAPVKTLVSEFNTYRKIILWRAGYNCQQRSLKALLNRVFEDTRAGRSFQILTNSDLKPKYYEPLGEDESGLTDPLYAGLSTEANITPIYVGFGYEYNSSISFTVYAPIECINQEAEIKAWVAYYRFTSKDFRITYI